MKNSAREAAGKISSYTRIQEKSDPKPAQSKEFSHYVTNTLWPESRNEASRDQRSVDYFQHFKKSKEITDLPTESVWRAASGLSGASANSVWSHQLAHAEQEVWQLPVVWLILK